jgi:hypothetical protein
MLLGLQCCLFGTDKGEVRYSLSQNNAPVSTSLATWIKLSPVIGPMPGENLEWVLQLFGRREPQVRSMETAGSLLLISKGFRKPYHGVSLQKLNPGLNKAEVLAHVSRDANHYKVWF